jgi:hypothetical protein
MFAPSPASTKQQLEAQLSQAKQNAHAIEEKKDARAKLYEKAQHDLEETRKRLRRKAPGATWGLGLFAAKTTPEQEARIEQYIQSNNEFDKATRAARAAREELDFAKQELAAADMHCDGLRKMLAELDKALAVGASPGGVTAIRVAGAEMADAARRTGELHNAVATSAYNVELERQMAQNALLQQQQLAAQMQHNLQVAQQQAARAPHGTH